MLQKQRSKSCFEQHAEVFKNLTKCKSVQEEFQKFHNGTKDLLKLHLNFYTTQTTKSDNFELAGSTGGNLAGSQKPAKLERNLPEI